MLHPKPYKLTSIAVQAKPHLASPSSDAHSTSAELEKPASAGKSILSQRVHNRKDLFGAPNPSVAITMRRLGSSAKLTLGLTSPSPASVLSTPAEAERHSAGAPQSHLPNAPPAPLAPFYSGANTPTPSPAKILLDGPPHRHVILAAERKCIGGYICFPKVKLQAAGKPAAAE